MTPTGASSGAQPHEHAADAGYLTTAPRFVRHAIAGGLLAGGQGRKGAGNIGLAALCAAIAAAITAALALCWYGALAVVWAFPTIGPVILGLFAAWARLIGAI